VELDYFKGKAYAGVFPLVTNIPVWPMGNEEKRIGKFQIKELEN
jgi:hypothetical protein